MNADNEHTDERFVGRPAPDFTKSFVRVPRSVLRGLQGDVVALAVYMAILDRTAYEAGPRNLRGHGVMHLEVGEAVLGRSELVASGIASESKVRSALNRLRALGFIASKSTNLGTVVTVCGYAGSATARPSTSPADSPSTSPADSPTTHQQTASGFASGLTTNGDLRSEKGEKGERGDTHSARVKPLPLSQEEKAEAEQIVSALHAYTGASYHLIEELEAVVSLRRKGHSAKNLVLLAQYTADDNGLGWMNKTDRDGRPYMRSNLNPMTVFSERHVAKYLTIAVSPDAWAPAPDWGAIARGRAS